MGTILTKPWFFFLLATLLSQLWIAMFSFLRCIVSLLSFSLLLLEFDLQYLDRKNKTGWRAVLEREFDQPLLKTPIPSPNPSSSFKISTNSIKTCFLSSAGGRPPDGGAHLRASGRQQWSRIESCARVCFPHSIWADHGCMKYEKQSAPVGSGQSF